jgi:NDP-sugar pyrophosphorylase family protein
MTAPTLLVLAAGMGSRYGGLKQIEPVGPSGEAILDYSVFDALRAGFGKIVFVIRHDIEEAFRTVIGSRYEGHADVEYVFQELSDLPDGFTLPEGRTKPWGTTQAVLAAKTAITTPFAVLNADDFYGADSFRALSSHLQSDTDDSTLIGYTLRNTLSPHGSVARGVCEVDASGYLQAITEYTAIEADGNAARTVESSGQSAHFTGDELVSMNMWGFTPALFAQLETCFEKFLAANHASLKAECYLPSSVGDLLKAGSAKVRVTPTTGTWFGVTYREDHPQVVEAIAALVRSGAYPEKLWQ